MNLNSDDVAHSDLEEPDLKVTVKPCQECIMTLDQNSLRLYLSENTTSFVNLRRPI